MDDDRSSRNDEETRPGTKKDWRVDAAATRARLGETPAGAAGGEIVYTDANGHRRRLPADMSRLGSEEIEAAATALSYELGAPDPSYAQIVAIERLNELHASGAFSDEDHLREKRRILGQG